MNVEDEEEMEGQHWEMGEVGDKGIKKETGKFRV